VITATFLAKEPKMKSAQRRTRTPLRQWAAVAGVAVLTLRVAVVYARAATSPVGAAPLATPTTFSTRRADIHMTEEENSLAGMIATGLPLLQAGPVVCASPQGIVCPSVLTHWMKDLRGLERPTAT
jgi:hypothetical protein